MDSLASESVPHLGDEFPPFRDCHYNERHDKLHGAATAHYAKAPSYGSVHESVGTVVAARRARTGSSLAGAWARAMEPWSIK